jgi:hypothetical protein
MKRPTKNLDCDSLYDIPSEPWPLAWRHFTQVYSSCGGSPMSCASPHEQLDLGGQGDPGWTAFLAGAAVPMPAHRRAADLGYQ